MDYKDMNAIGIVRLMLTDGVISQEVAGKYFPELKETEDERISKEISTYISNVLNNVTQLTPRTNQVDEWLSWLKKQGERKSAEWTEDDEIKVKAMCEEGNLKPSEREWLKNLRYRVTKKKSDVFTERDRNIINNICENIQGHFKFSDVCKEDAVRYLRSLEGRIQSEKWWTDEDYKVYKSIIDDAVNKDLALTSIQKEWLKSLEERVQPMQELSEEDENMIKRIKEYLNIAIGDLSNKLNRRIVTIGNSEYSSMMFDITECISWLEVRFKSIKPQNMWKPSDRELGAILAAIGDEKQKGSDITKELQNIYQQLKKLSEE